MTKKSLSFASRVMMSWVKPSASPPRTPAAPCISTNGITTIEARFDAACAVSTGRSDGLSSGMAGAGWATGNAAGLCSLSDFHADRTGAKW